MINLDTTNLQDIKAAKGRRFYLRLAFTEEDEVTAVDFTGKTLKMEVKRYVGGSELLSFAVGEGLAIAANEVTLTKATIDLAEGVYLYDLIQTDADGSETIMKGNFQVINSVTTP